jgi:hypothetical protein
MPFFGQDKSAGRVIFEHYLYQIAVRGCFTTKLYEESAEPVKFFQIKFLNIRVLPCVWDIHKKNGDLTPADYIETSTHLVAYGRHYDTASLLVC